MTEIMNSKIINLGNVLLGLNSISIYIFFLSRYAVVYYRVFIPNNYLNSVLFVDTLVLIITYV